MFMRDALPPTRVDVLVLFDQCLRAQGIQTDYAGHPSQATVPAATPQTTACSGRQFDTGPRNDPRSLWREVRLLWQRAQEYDLIVVRDKPLAAAALFLVARFKHRPCVYWMSFPMPLGDKMGAKVHWQAGRWVKAALCWLRGSLAQWVQDRWVLAQAQHVFVQSQAMMEQVLLTTALPAVRMSAVPMGVDVQNLPAPSQAAVADGNAPTIAYLGSLDRARELNVLIDAFVLVLAQHARATLVLVGGAPREEDVAWLRSYAAACGVLERVVFTGPLPMKAAWQRLLEATVCVSAVPPGPLHDVSSPTKVVEYLALGLPVVANDIPDQRLLLEACGGGVCVAFTAPAFAQALVSLLNDPAQARARARQARPRVLALRSYTVLSQQVATALRGALA
jgi:glycosyltransferase involved in cell wall biosynthesis